MSWRHTETAIMNNMWGLYMTIKKIQIIGATFICLYLSMGLAHGTTYTWIKAGDGNWGDSANWSPSGYPQAGDTAKFDNNTGRTITLEANHSVDAVEVTKGAWTWNGNSLSVGSIFDYKSDVNNLSTLNSTLSGTGSLRVAPTRTDGQLNVNGDNSFSGGSVLESGRLIVNHSNALGTGTLTIKGTAACLNQMVANNTIVTIPNNIILDGDIYNVTPRSGYGNTTVKTTGTVTLTGNRDIYINADGNGSKGALEFAGTFTDNGNGYGVSKSGTGNLTLSGSVEIGGDILVNAGQVFIPNANPNFTKKIKIIDNDLVYFSQNYPNKPSVYVGNNGSLGSATIEWHGTPIQPENPYPYGRIAYLNRGADTSLTLTNSVTMSGVIASAGSISNQVLTLSTANPTIIGDTLFMVVGDGNNTRTLAFANGLTDNGKGYMVGKAEFRNLYLLGDNNLSGPFNVYYGLLRLTGDNTGMTGPKNLYDATIELLARGSGQLLGPMPWRMADTRSRLILRSSDSVAATALPELVFDLAAANIDVIGVDSGTTWTAEKLTRRDKAMLIINGTGGYGQLNARDKLKINGWTVPANGMVAPWMREASGYFLTYDPDGSGIKQATHVGGNINTVANSAIFSATGTQVLDDDRQVQAIYANANIGGSGKTLTVTSGGMTAIYGRTFDCDIEFNEQEGILRTDENSNTTIFNGTLKGSGGFTKSGRAMLLLNHANTLTGTIAILSGTVRLGVPGALVDGQPLFIASNGDGAYTSVLDLFGNSLAPSQITTSGGYILNSSNVTSTLTLPAEVIYRAGYTTANIAPAATNRPLNVVLGGPTTFTIENGYAEPDFNIGLIDNSRFVTISGINAPIAKYGPGFMRFAGSNTFTGNITVDDGILEGYIRSANFQAFGDSGNKLFLKRTGAVSFTGGGAGFSTTLGDVEVAGANVVRNNSGTSAIAVNVDSLTRKSGSRATLKMLGTSGPYHWNLGSRDFKVLAWVASQPNVNRIFAPWCVHSCWEALYDRATFSYITTAGLVKALNGVGNNVYQYHRSSFNSATANDVIDLAAAANLTANLEIYALRTAFNITASGGETLTLGSGGLIANDNITLAPKLKFGTSGTAEALIYAAGYRSYQRTVTLSDAVVTSGGLTKFGEGILALAGDSSATLSGAHWVNEGVLRLANANALKSDADVNIERYAKVDIDGNYTLAHNFKGLGSITTGDNTLTLTGSLTPGFSIGTLAVEKLNFQGTLNWEYNDDETDLVECKSLTLGGSKTVNASWIGTGEAKAGTFPLFTYKGNDPTLGSWTVNAPAGLVGSVSIDSSAKQVVLELSAAPKGIIILIR